MDDTFTFVKKAELKEVLDALNSLHNDIKFTHEMEQDRCIPFLDVWVRRQDNGSFTTSVYRKKTSSDIYINWESYAPRTWKIGTLHGLLQRAFMICSNKTEVEKEIKYLSNVFEKVNGYPNRVIQSTITKVRNKNATESLAEQATETDSTTEEETEVVRPHISLPYGGDKGNTILKKFKHILERILPDTVKPGISVKGRKIGSFFTLKDKVDEKHLSGFIYEFECNRKPTCESEYIGETNRRKEIRENEHAHLDEGSAILQHCKKTKHARAKPKNFKVLARNYPHWQRRKLCESMFIRDRNPDLNKQGDKHRQSYKLHLFA